MKKIFTTILVLCTAWSMQAALHLSYNNWVGEDLETGTITQDTTIVVTEYEYDERGRGVKVVYYDGEHNCSGYMTYEYYHT